MDRRLKLQAELEAIVGNKNVYWQPPENLKLKYPCIVYEERPIELTRADNRSYMKKQSWDVTYIRTFTNRNLTDETLHEFTDRFTYCRHNQHFISDNLIHDVFTIYY